MTTVNVNFAAPRTMLIGGGAVRQVAELLGKLGLSRPLLVSDEDIVAIGLIQRCLGPLAAAGITASVFSDFVPEPLDTAIAAGVRRLTSGDYDCLIGFG